MGFIPFPSFFLRFCNICEEASNFCNKITSDKKIKIDNFKNRNAITIIDAKDCGISYEEISRKIDEIAEKELSVEQEGTKVTCYLKEDYFFGIPIKPGLSSPENILLAMHGKEITGFIITGKKTITEKRSRWSIASLPTDTGYIAYLAVDSKFKRFGIGTNLMFAAMKKAKELGKKYIVLEYIAEGPDIKEEEAKIRGTFYNKFSDRFRIPKEEFELHSDRRKHIRPTFNLTEFDPTKFMV